MTTVEERGELNAVASLAEPLRRALYEFVAGSSDAVSRDEAADALGLSRQVAAYHLDRLAGDGLLETEFRRLTGRTGPGAGRPSKLYRRTAQEHLVSIPPRRYELAARILLESVRQGGLAPSYVAGAAREVGRQMGRGGLGPALEATGYAPEISDGETRFRNCPFHTLREQDAEMTCGLSLALVEGMIEGSGVGVIAHGQPEEGYCCVRLKSVGPNPSVSDGQD